MYIVKHTENVEHIVRGAFLRNLPSEVFPKLTRQCSTHCKQEHVAAGRPSVNGSDTPGHAIQCNAYFLTKYCSRSALNVSYNAAYNGMIETFQIV